MLERIRLSGSLSPSSGFRAAWRPFSDWPSPNTPSESRDPSSSSDKPASPSDFSCLLCLIASQIRALFSRSPFHLSISLLADLFLISVELTSEFTSTFLDDMAHFCSNQAQDNPGKYASDKEKPEKILVEEQNQHQCAKADPVTYQRSKKNPFAPFDHRRSLSWHCPCLLYNNEDQQWEPNGARMSVPACKFARFIGDARIYT